MGTAPFADLRSVIDGASCWSRMSWAGLHSTGLHLKILILELLSKIHWFYRKAGVAVPSKGGNLPVWYRDST